jgi:hypothetical protein
MAENKNSFILYSDSKEVVEALTNEQAGKLLKHIFSYVNDEAPECDDPFVNLAFIPIKQSLKRDLKKWEGKQEQRKSAGKRSAEVRKQNANEANRKATTVNDRSVSSTVNVSVNGSVSGSVSGNVSKETISFPETEKLELEILESETKKPVESEKKKSSAKKRKEEIFPECKQYFLDYYKNQKGVDFYWTAAEATATNQLIQKIRTISGGHSDQEVLKLFYTFIDKVKAADDWVYENLSIKIMNSKFNELVPKMKSVNAAGQKTNIPNGYEELLKKHQNNINNGKS